jgi:N-methylhydantoinase B
MPTPDVATDPVTLEVLRTRLEAISDESAITIERTAISPVVTESKDYSATLLDGDGNLVSGGGRIEYHFGAAMNAVRSTIARHGDTIVPGDVFLANDPHNGGGLHAQDVMVQQPVFVDGLRVAWVVNSAHLMDMGGMVMGSWAPAATECFQEAIRFPPVRLFRAGVEQPDVWAIFRNNVRLSPLVEMDLRALVAGCHVAEDKLVDVVRSMGVEPFGQAVAALFDAGERELRRRIGSIADGTYRVVTWTEWGEELYAVPCTLTVDGDRLVFDFEGSSPQAPHFFNSKPYIIESELVADVCTFLAQDLPFSAGLFRPFEVRCPAGSIVNSSPPAPVASAHMDAAFNAATVAAQCVVLALAASPHADGRRYLSGPSGTAGLATHTWGCTVDGAFDGWAMLDGCLPAPSAGHDRDGNDLFAFLVGRQGIVEFIDVEILESWYPLLVTEKKPRPGAAGAGQFRSGAGCQMSYRPYGTDALYGVMLGMREHLPLTGMAGGLPGATTRFTVHHPDGAAEPIDGHAAGVVVNEGDTFEFLCASGGGWGDPVCRQPAAVADDVALGRITAAEAADVYGVVLDGDGLAVLDATEARRAEIRSRRLAGARPAARPVDGLALPGSGGDAGAGSGGDAGAPAGGPAPLYPGVVQRGRVAVSDRSGATLAVAPDHWTDGCPVLEERRRSGDLTLLVEAYLDPATGHTLCVDVRPEGAERTFTTLPSRWVTA